MSIEQTQNEVVLVLLVIVAVALRHLPLALAAFPHWHLVLASLKAALLQQLKVCACMYCVCVHFRFALVVACHGGVRCTSLKCKNKCHAWTKQAHTSTHHTRKHTLAHTSRTLFVSYTLYSCPSAPPCPCHSTLAARCSLLSSSLYYAWPVNRSCNASVRQCACLRGNACVCVCD